MRKFKIIFLFTFFALLSVVCSNDNSTDPYEEATDLQSLYMDIFSVTDYDSVEVLVSDSADASISLSSGVGDTAAIELESQEVLIICPDSAVASDVDCSIISRMIKFVRNNDSSEVAMSFECGPDGTVFDESLVIDVSTEGFNNHPNSNVVKLFLYNEHSNKWNVVQTGQKNHEREQFEIDHFSKYAISD